MNERDGNLIVVDMSDVMGPGTEECDCRTCQLKRALAKMFLGQGESSLKDKNGKTVLFATLKDGQMLIGIPLDNYDDVKKLIDIRKKIEEEARLSSEIPACIPIFKDIFNGNADAYKKMPRSGIDRVLSLRKSLLYLFGIVKTELERVSKARDLETLGSYPSNEDAEDDTALFYTLLEVINGDEYEQWISEHLSLGKDLFRTAPFTIIDAAINDFKKSILGQETKKLPGVLKEIIRKLRRKESGLLKKLPKDFHEDKQPSFIEITTDELILAAQNFAKKNAAPKPNVVSS
jgi:hypothetical protein